MAEMDGPGCIFRIWSANPQGLIRFYLDGDTKPTYEWDFHKLFTGTIDPFIEPLVWTATKQPRFGRRRFCPSPSPELQGHQRHCRARRQDANAATITLSTALSLGLDRGLVQLPMSDTQWPVRLQPRSGPAGQAPRPRGNRDRPGRRSLRLKGRGHSGPAAG
jgi:hypothetical protein